MKIKSLLILVLSLVTLTAFGQDGGIKGRVVSRAGRIALGDVKITMTPGGTTTVSDAQGNFVFENIPAGEYSLQFETPEFETSNIAVRVGSQMRDINAVILVPDTQRQMIDDAVFAEFDTETTDDAQALPTSLSASKDLFNNIASYKFSEMRFNVRGYDSQYQDVYMNGIQLNDAMTGYTPWSLWSGLNDATRNQEVTSGIVASDAGLGGIGGTTNIVTSPSQMRQGLRASLVNGNSMYRFRAMVTYASGHQDNGWSYAFSVSTRQGGNSYVNGVYYNAFGYFAAVEKQFGQRHRLALTLLGAPTERGAQQAATQEAYDLVGTDSRPTSLTATARMPQSSGGTNSTANRSAKRSPKRCTEPAATGRRLPRRNAPGIRNGKSGARLRRYPAGPPAIPQQHLPRYGKRGPSRTVLSSHFNRRECQQRRFRRFSGLAGIRSSVICRESRYNRQ